MPGNQITFGVGFNVNEAGLNKLKQSLQEIQKMTAKDAFATGNFSSLQAANKELTAAKASAQQLQNALLKAFNPQLGTTNLSKFSAELQKINVGQLASQMNNLGATGQAAFLDLTKHALSLQAPLKQNYTLLTKIGQTLANTIKWNVASSAVNAFTGSIQSAYNYVKALDSSLTDIRIVTGQSREEMAQFAQQANEAAQALGRQTKDYTNAALAFYQQGLGEAEVQARTEATLKAQNVTGAGTEMADYLTAVWNGFQVSAENTEKYVDKLAAVADSSASNLSELAVGMSKVASTANAMGVDMDQLTAQLATIIATTRQAPETVGNALKTIYARINDIKSGSDEAEISLGNYTSKMAALGFSVLDVDGKLKDTGTTMEEIGDRWGTLTREQQIYLAQTMAGQRQMNNLIALFDNWQKYSDMLNVSLGAEGALNEKNARYMDSLSAHINQFKASVEGMQDALINEDSIMKVYDAGSKLMNLFTLLINSVGGMEGVLAGLGALGARVFANQISNSVVTAINNFRAAQEQVKATASEMQILQSFNTSSADFKNLAPTAPLRQAVDAIKALKTEVQDYASVMGQAQRETQDSLIAQKTAIEQELLVYDELIQKATKMGNVGLALMNASGNDVLGDTFNPKDILNIDFGAGTINFADNGIEQLENLRDVLTYVHEEYNSFLTDLDKVKGAAQSQRQLTLAISEQEQKVAELQQKVQELESSGAGKKAIKAARQELQAAQKELNNLKQSLSDNQIALQDFAKTVQASMEGEKLFGEQTDKVTQILQRLGTEGNNDVADLAVLERIFKECGASADQAQAQLAKLKERMPELKAEAEQTTTAFKRFAQELKDLKVGAAVAGLLQGVSSMAMGITTLKSAIDTYKGIQDGTVDATEGWLRIITSVSMGLPMMVSGITTTLSSLNTISTGISTALLGIQGLPSILGATSLGLAGATEGAGMLISTLAGLSPYILIIGLITAGVVALYNALTDEHKKFKEAQKAADDAAKKAEELRTKYDDLKSTISSYQEAYNAIGTLTAGTEEWREAIEKTNEEAAKLLELWPELAYTINENGIIGIDAADLEKARAEMLRQSALADVEAALLERDAASQHARDIAQKNSAPLKKGNDDYQTDLINATRIIEQIPQLRVAIKRTGDLDEDFLTPIYEALLDQFHGAPPPDIIHNQAIQDKLYEIFPELDALLEQYNLSVDQFVDLVRNAKIDESLLTAIEDEQQAIAKERGKLKVAAARVINDLQVNQSGLAAQLMSAAIVQYQDDVEKLSQIINDPSEYVQAANKIAQVLQSDQDIINILGNFIGDFENGVGDLLKGNLNRNQIEQVSNVLRENFASFGFDSEADAMSVFGDAYEIWKARFQTILDNVSAAVKPALESLDPTNSIFSPDQFKQLAEQFRQAYIHNSGEEGINILSDFYASLAEKDRAAAVEVLDKIKPGITSESLQKLFEEADINLDGFEGSLEDLIQALINGRKAISDPFAEAQEAASDSKKKQNSAHDIVDDLHYGDAISSEDYATLSTYLGSALGEFFTITTDGTYELRGSARFLKEAIDEVETQQLLEGLTNVNERIAELKQLGEDLTNWNFDEDQFTQNASNTGYNFNDQDASNAANMMGAFISEGGSDNIMLLEEAKALQEQLKQGAQDVTTETLQQLQQVRDFLLGLTQNTEELTELQQKYADALANVPTLDQDVKVEDWENLRDTIAELGDGIQGVSADVRDNIQVAGDISEAILRFDDTIVDVTEHYDDWMKMLESDAAQDHAKVVNELRDAYGDLLDLDGNTLSDAFLESTDNLNLMKDAVNNVDGAYEELQQRAQSDILLNEVKVDLDDADFWSKYNTFQDELAGLDLPSLDVGASLDNTDFIAACNEMINAAGMTADQATAYLAACGVDAQVDYEPITEQVTSTVSDLQVTPSAPVTYTYANPATGVPTEGQAQGLITTAVPHDVTETRATGAFRLKVTSANKSSGGDFKYNNASHGGGSSGGGGKKGGGGGGGNKAPKKKDPIKKFKAKIDPYHDVNIKIGDTQEALDKLGKQRNKLIGKDAVDNLTKQIDLMEQEKDLLKEKNAIAQSELDRQAKELANLGAIFEKNGDIANYKQLLLDKQNQVNNAIAVANGLVGDERDAYEKYVNQLKDEYKELEDAIKEYDETMQLMDDLSADYQDLVDKQIELAIEAFDLEINVKLDLKDAEKDFNDFRKKIIDEVKDDQYGGLAEAAARNYSSYYNVDNRGNVGGIIPDLRQHAQDVQREIQIMTNGGWSQIYGDNLAAAADDLKKYNDELMDALEEAQDVIDETHDHFLDAIDAMDEAFDTQQDNLDKIDDLLNHDMEILQLIHGEENFDEMDRLWQQQINQDTARLEALQAEQKYWQDRLKDYEEGTDEWKKAMENWQDAFEKTNEAMMTSIENLQSKWENSINSIMSSLRNATYGGNMDAALEDWDKLTWHSDRYLDSLERANGLLDLQHNYIDAINATNDPKLQQKLADLEEKQLEALSNKEHIREIDLQIAQQQLTVLQAQMALEDAQQAKTKLRLRRDSQGNYTYQYVADEDDIAEKTQEYAKALADYREMVKNSLHEDLQDLSDYTQEFYDKMQEAQMKYGDDTKALMAEQERLYELYMGEDGYITRLAKDAQSSMQDYQTATFTQAMGLNNLLEEDLFNKFLGPDSEMRVAINDLLGAGGEIPSLIDSFINDSALVAFDTISEATKKTLSGPEGLLPEWQSALWTIADTYDTDFVPRVINAMNYLQQANQSYVNGLAIMQQAANRTTEQIALGLAYDTAYTNALDEATKTLLTTQDAQLSKAEKVYESLKKNEQAFKDQSEAAIDAANAMFLYWLSLNGQTASGLPYSLEGVTPNIRITTPTIVSNQPSYTGSSYGDDGGGGGGGGNSGNTGGGSKPAPTTPRTTSSYGGNRDSSAYWAAAYDRSRLATGGYTGEWNDEPRLAWLDQKELVLNSDDTKNILDSVNIVRTIADRVTAMTGAAAASMSATSAAGLMSTIGQTILQDVIINADFPAVQDAAQIKQAFNELVNLASQRASINRRA